MQSLRLWRDSRKVKRNIALALIPATVSTIVVATIPAAHAADSAIVPIYIGAAQQGTGELDYKTMQPKDVKIADAAFNGVYIKGEGGYEMRVVKAYEDTKGNRVIAIADTSGTTDTNTCSPNLVQVSFPKSENRLIMKFNSISASAVLSAAVTGARAADVKLSGFDVDNRQFVPTASGSGAAIFTVESPRDVALELTGAEGLQKIADNSTDTKNSVTYQAALRSRDQKQVTVKATSKSSLDLTIPANRMAWDYHDNAGSANAHITVSDVQQKDTVNYDSNKTFKISTAITSFPTGTSTNIFLSKLNINGQIFGITSPAAPWITPEKKNQGLAGAQDIANEVNKFWNSTNGYVVDQDVKTGVNAGMRVQVHVDKLKNKAKPELDLRNADDAKKLLDSLPSDARNNAWTWTNANYFEVEYTVTLTSVRDKLDFSYEPAFASNPLMYLQDSPVMNTGGVTGALHLAANFSMDPYDQTLFKIDPNAERFLTNSQVDPNHNPPVFDELELKRWADATGKARLNGEEKGGVYFTLANGYTNPKVVYQQGDVKEEYTPTRSSDGKYYIGPWLAGIVKTGTKYNANGFTIAYGGIGTLSVTADKIEVPLEYGTAANGAAVGLTGQTVNPVDAFNVRVQQPAQNWVREDGQVISAYQLQGIKNGVTTGLQQVNFGDLISLRDLNAFTDAAGNKRFDKLVLTPVYSTNYRGPQLYTINLGTGVKSVVEEGGATTSPAGTCVVQAIPGLDVTVLQPSNAAKTIVPTKGNQNSTTITSSTPSNLTTVELVDTSKWALNPRVPVVNNNNVSAAEQDQVKDRVLAALGARTIAGGKAGISVAVNGATTVQFFNATGNTERTFTGSNMVYQLPTQAEIAGLTINRVKVGNVSNLTQAKRSTVQSRLQAAAQAKWTAPEIRVDEITVNQDGTATMQVSYNNNGTWTPISGTIARDNLVYQEVTGGESTLESITLNPLVGVKDDQNVTGDAQGTSGETKQIRDAVTEVYTGTGTHRDKGGKTFSLPATALSNWNIAKNGAVKVTVTLNGANGQPVTYQVDLTPEKVIYELAPQAAEFSDITLKPLVGVVNRQALTSDEQAAVATAVKNVYTGVAQDKDGKKWQYPAADVTVSVGTTGNASVTIKVPTATGGKEEVKFQLDSGRLIYQLPKNDVELRGLTLKPKVEVADKTALSEIEKRQVEAAVKAVYTGDTTNYSDAYGKKFNLDASWIESISVAADGSATVKVNQPNANGTKDAKTVTIAGEQLVVQRQVEQSKLAGLTLSPLVGVVNAAALSTTEKTEVENAIKAVYTGDTTKYRDANGKTFKLAAENITGVTVKDNGPATVYVAQPNAQGGIDALNVDLPANQLIYQLPKTQAQLQGIKLNPLVGVVNARALTDAEKSTVAAAVTAVYTGDTRTYKDANGGEFHLQAADVRNIQVAADGTTTLRVVQRNSSGVEVPTDVTLQPNQVIYQLPKTQAELQAIALRPLVGVKDTTNLTAAEKDQVKAAITAVYTGDATKGFVDRNGGKFNLLASQLRFTDVAADGTTKLVVTQSDDQGRSTSTDVTLPGSNLVYQLLPTSEQILGAVKLNPLVPVADKAKLTGTEQTTVQNRVKEQLTKPVKDGGLELPASAIKSVTTAATGDDPGATTIVLATTDPQTGTPSKLQVTVPSVNLIEQLMPADDLLTGVKLVPREGVDNITALTEVEKTTVAARIKAAYVDAPLSIPAKLIESITVNADGSADVVFKSKGENDPARKTIHLVTDNLVYQKLPADSDLQGLELLPRVPVTELGNVTAEEQQEVNARVLAKYTLAKENGGFGLPSTYIKSVDTQTSGDAVVTFVATDPQTGVKRDKQLTIPAANLVIQKLIGSESEYAISLEPREVVQDKTNLTGAEKDLVRNRMLNVYHGGKFNLNETQVGTEDIEIRDDGWATVTIDANPGSGATPLVINIEPEKLIVQAPPAEGPKVLAGIELLPRIPVKDRLALTAEEKAKVEAGIQAVYAAKPFLLDSNSIKTVVVGDNGDTVVTVAPYGVNSKENEYWTVNLPWQKLVVQEITEELAAQLAKIELNPREEVADVTNLTPAEKATVETRIREVYAAAPFNLDETSIRNVAVGADGNTVVTYAAQGLNTPASEYQTVNLAADRLVVQKVDQETINKMAGIELNPREPVAHYGGPLTPAEKQAVASRITAVYAAYPFHLSSQQLRQVEVTDAGDAVVTVAPQGAATAETNLQTINLDKAKLTIQKLTEQEVNDFAARVVLNPREAVVNVNALTAGEQQTVADRIWAEVFTPQHLDEQTIRSLQVLPTGQAIVVVAPNGDTSRLAVITVPKQNLVVQQISDINALASIALVPRVEVENKLALTRGEKEEVHDRILAHYAAAPFWLDGSVIREVTVGDDGTAVVTVAPQGATTDPANFQYLTLPSQNLIVQKLQQSAAELAAITLDPRVPVRDLTALTATEKHTVATRIREVYAAAPFLLDENSVVSVVVENNGATTVKVAPAGVNSLPSSYVEVHLQPEQLIVKAFDEDTFNQMAGIELKPREEVDNKLHLTLDEKARVENRVREVYAAQPFLMNEDYIRAVEVGDDGETTVVVATKGATSRDVDLHRLTIAPEQLIRQRFKATDEQLSGISVVPRIGVDDRDQLTPADKERVEEAIRETYAAEPFLLDDTMIKDIIIDDKGNVTTIVFNTKGVDSTNDDVKSVKVAPEQVVAEAPGENWQLQPRVEVADDEHLTAAEKAEVQSRVQTEIGQLASNVTVADDGTTTVTYSTPVRLADGTITGEITLQPAQVIHETIQAPGEDWHLDPLIPVVNDQNLTTDEKAQVADAVRDRFNDGDVKDVTVGADGTTTITFNYPTSDGSTTATLKPEQVIESAITYPDENWQLEPLVPVVDPAHLQKGEKRAVEDGIRATWPDQIVRVEVADNGETQIRFLNGRDFTVKPSQVITQGNYPDANWHLDPLVPVADKNNLTAAEQQTVTVRVTQALADPQPESVTVDSQGRTEVTYATGVVLKLNPEQVIEEIAKPQQQTTPDAPKLNLDSGREVKGVTVPGGVVHILRDGEEIGTVTADGAGNFSWSVPADIPGGVQLGVTVTADGLTSQPATFTTTDLEVAKSSSDYLGWLWLIPVILGLVGAGSYWAYVNQVDGGDRQPLQRGQANPADYIRWIQGLPARESGGLR